MSINRRDFIKIAGLGVASGSVLGCAGVTKKTSSGRVVIIGGGYAGAAAAKYLRMWSNNTIEVIVVEKNPQFVSCPLSNLVLGGSKSINDLTFGYDLLKNNHGIHWVKDEVTAINTSGKKVTTQRGGDLKYDRLI